MKEIPLAEISEVKKRLQSIIDTALDGIITIDENGTIESINQAGADIFEYDLSGLIGMNINLLMSNPHRHKHSEYIQSYLETGEKKIIGTKREVIGRKKDGTLFPFRLAVSEIQLSNKSIFTGIIHDLTDEKKSEEAIIKINMELEKQVAIQTFELKMAIEKLIDTNKKLEAEIKEKTKIESKLIRSREKLSNALEKEKELNEMKSRFVSMTSHEFRTPLSTIFSSANIIDRYPNSDQYENRAVHTKKIKKSVTMLINILDEFLNLTKLEKDVVVIRKESEAYSLSTFCHSTIAELESILKIGQTIKFESEIEIFIALDASILKQIIINLLSNAIKYSKENSTICVKVSEIDNLLYISFEDQGIGIPHDEQKYLFTRFFRASNSTHIQGTGLGLHLVLHYLKLLNGKISYTSVENEGTIFTSEIPL